MTERLPYLFFLAAALIDGASYIVEWFNLVLAEGEISSDPLTESLLEPYEFMASVLKFFLPSDI
jgi:hypothetical protein